MTWEQWQELLASRTHARRLMTLDGDGQHGGLHGFRQGERDDGNDRQPDHGEPRRRVAPAPHARSTASVSSPRRAPAGPRPGARPGGPAHTNPGRVQRGAHDAVRVDAIQPVRARGRWRAEGAVEAVAKHREAMRCFTEQLTQPGDGGLPRTDTGPSGHNTPATGGRVAPGSVGKSAGGEPVVSGDPIYQYGSASLPESTSARAAGRRQRAPARRGGVATPPRRAARGTAWSGPSPQILHRGRAALDLVAGHQRRTGPAVPGEAIFQAAFSASPMPEFSPRAPNGAIEWAASPASSTRCRRTVGTASRWWNR